MQFRFHLQLIFYLESRWVPSKALTRHLNAPSQQLPPLHFVRPSPGKRSALQTMLPFGHASPGVIGTVYSDTFTPGRAQRHRSSLELVLLHRGSAGGCSAGRRSPSSPCPGGTGGPRARGSPRPTPELPPVISGISGRKVACSDLPSRGHKVPGASIPSVPFPHCSIARQAGRGAATPSPLPPPAGGGRRLYLPAND